MTDSEGETTPGTDSADAGPAPKKKKRDVAFYWYLAAGVIPGIASALSIRFLVILLTKEQFGDWGYYKAIGAALVPIASLSLPAAMMRMYFDYDKDSHREKRELVSTVARLVSAGALFTGLLGVGAHLILSDPWLPLYLGLVTTATVLVSFFEYLCRTRDHYLLYFVNRFLLWGGFVTVLTLMSMGTVPVWFWGVGSDPLGVAVVFFGICLWLVVAVNFAFFLGKRVISLTDRLRKAGSVRELLAFSLPLSVTYFLGWMLNQSDQYVLKHLSTADELASYVFAAEVTMVVTLITSSALTDWPSFFYGKMRDNDADRDQLVVRRIRFYLLLHIGAVLVIRLLGDVIYELFEAEAYKDGLAYLGVLLLGNFCFLAANLYGSSITYAKKTSWVTVIWTSSGLVNLVLNLLLIPTYGAKAAALTTLCGYGTLMLLCWFLGRRHYRIPDARGQTALFFLAAAASLTPLPF